MDGRYVCVSYLENSRHQEAWEEGKLEEAVCWETLGPAIPVDVTLTPITYLSPIEDLGNFTSR